MGRAVATRRSVKPAKPAYVLDEQIGFILRQVSQRHAVIFARDIGIDLTPTQWAALAKLQETGPCSQNQLGRLTAMDPATIQGVIRRLEDRALIERAGDPGDRRRTRLRLSAQGKDLVVQMIEHGVRVSEATLAPLDDAERTRFLALLERLI